MSALFTSAGEITRQPTKEDIQQLAVKNPIIMASLQMEKLGQINHQDALYLIVAMLAHQNEYLFKTLSERSIRGPL